MMNFRVQDMVLQCQKIFFRQQGYQSDFWAAFLYIHHAQIYLQINLMKYILT